MLYLLSLYTNAIKVEILDVHTVNAVVLVTRVVKVYTLYTSVYKNLKYYAKKSKKPKTLS